MSSTSSNPIILAKFLSFINEERQIAIEHGYEGAYDFTPVKVSVALRDDFGYSFKAFTVNGWLFTVERRNDYRVVSLSYNGATIFLAQFAMVNKLVDDIIVALESAASAIFDRYTSDRAAAEAYELLDLETANSH